MDHRVITSKKGEKGMRVNITTKAQRNALKRKWDIDNQGMSYLAFRRLAKNYGDYIMVLWCNMWLGIEKDGYTHS